MSVYYIASLKIIYFIARDLGNEAKPRDHDPPILSLSKVHWVRGCRIYCEFRHVIDNAVLKIK